MHSTLCCGWQGWARSGVCGCLTNSVSMQTNCMTQLNLFYKFQQTRTLPFSAAMIRTLKIYLQVGILWDGMLSLDIWMYSAGKSPVKALFLPVKGHLLSVTKARGGGRCPHGRWNPPLYLASGHTQSMNPREMWFGSMKYQSINQSLVCEKRLQVHVDIWMQNSFAKPGIPGST